MKQRTTFKAMAQRAANHARVLEELNHVGGLTALELADAMGVHRTGAERFLRQMHAEQKVHIGSWLRAEVGASSGHHPTRVWVAGPGRDAPRPKPEPRQVAHARYREKMRLVIAAKRSKPDSYKPNLANNPFWQLMA